MKLVLAELPNVDPSDDAFEHKMTVLKKKLGDRRSSELAQQMAGPKAA